MVGTLIAVVLGGVISVLSQVTLDATRARAQARTERQEITTAIRVIRFTFYSAEHVLREALETGRWWSPSDELNVAAAGEDLRALAATLPEEHWRIYTGAWRRLRECVRRAEAARLTEAVPGSAQVANRVASAPDTDSGSVISVADLQRILGAFISADDARHRLQTYVVERYTNEVLLSRICLTDQEIADAVDHYASQSADKPRWHARLRSSTNASQSFQTPQPRTCWQRNSEMGAAALLKVGQFGRRVARLRVFLVALRVSWPAGSGLSWLRSSSCLRW